MLLNDKGHVTVRQVDVVAHDEVVVAFIFHAVAVVEREILIDILRVKVSHHHFKALHFAALIADVYIVFLCNVSMAVSILEQQCHLVHIETFDLAILIDIPVDYKIERRRLLHTNAHCIFVATSGYIFDESLLLFLRNVQARLIDFLRNQVKLPYRAQIPEEYIPFVHRHAD